jgi:hypothetical protein
MMPATRRLCRGIASLISRHHLGHRMPQEAPQTERLEVPVDCRLSSKARGLLAWLWRIRHQALQ